MTVENDPWAVYLLKCADNTLYCGITRNLAKRMKQHNGMQAGGARYTRGRRPVELAGFLICEGKGAALRMEAAIKSMPRHAKLSFFQVGDNARA